MFIRREDSKISNGFGKRQGFRPAVGTEVEIGTVVSWNLDGSYEVAGRMDNFLVEAGGRTTRIS